MSGESERGFRLFGVELLPQRACMRKSASAGNLVHCNGGSNSSSLALAEALDSGYLSDGLLHSNSTAARARRKGVPWTEDEHRAFLVGLQKLGKGDWRGISRNYVKSRTPTQVASHAQKYFIRQSNLSKRKRRSSLFDMSTEALTDDSSVLRQQTTAAATTTAAAAAAAPPVVTLVKILEEEKMEEEMSSENGRCTSSSSGSSTLSLSLGTQGDNKSSKKESCNSNSSNSAVVNKTSFANCYADELRLGLALEPSFNPPMVHCT